MVPAQAHVSDGVDNRRQVASHFPGQGFWAEDLDPLDLAPPQSGIVIDIDKGRMPASVSTDSTRRPNLPAPNRTKSVSSPPIIRPSVSR